MSEKLKPCPFCGADAVYSCSNGNGTSFHVWCARCGARTAGKNTEDEAIEAWSRRAEPPAAPDDPARYSRGGIECIDAIRAALDPVEYRGFCKGSVLGYVWREKYKGGDRDLGKAVDFIGYALDASEEVDA